MDLYADVLQDNFYTCLIPFFDLCNHKGQEKPEEPRIDFALNF